MMGYNIANMGTCGIDGNVFTSVKSVVSRNLSQLAVVFVMYV